MNEWMSNSKQDSNEHEYTKNVINIQNSPK